MKLKQCQNLPLHKKTSRPKYFIGKFYQTLKEAMSSVLWELFQARKKDTPIYL